MKTCFTEEGCKVTLRGEVMMIGDRMNEKLYIMRMQAKPKKQATFIIQDNRTRLEWHKALGHPGKERLDNLVNDPELGLKVKSGPDENQCS